MSARQARLELARFLRSRRERISPDQVGLPVGRRRRTPGLRREEVAVLAGLSPTWYTYLEQAREIQPSPEVLDSLSNVLQLSEDERRYIHDLALGRAPERLDRQPETAWLVAELVNVAGNGPSPVYALDYAGEVIAWNAAAAEWYTDWSVREGIERNIVWWLMTSPDARERIVDWAEDARDIVGRTRALSARYRHDRKVGELIRRLHAVSPDFRTWWADHEVRGQRIRPRRLRHPELGIRSMWLAVVHPADDARMTVAFHLPCANDDDL
jgi:transcriptional regulator with XRE-family HTH domain